jgi:cell division protein FtsL
MRNSAAPIKLSTILKLVVVALVAVVFFILLIIQNINIKRLSEDLAERERKITALNREIQIRKSNLAGLKTPEFLLQQIKEMGLELREVSSEQIVRVFEQRQTLEPQQVARMGGAP